MAVKTESWDPADVLETRADVAAYLNAWLEDGTVEEIRDALGAVARSRGMSAISTASGVKRETLYKALGENGNPTLETVYKVLKALGLRLQVVPEDCEPEAETV